MTNVQQAIADLHIDTPLYRIVERDDGTIQLTTRDAVFEWTPRPVEAEGMATPPPAPAASAKPRAKRKASK